MLDFAWSELFVVIIVAVLAVGPKQLPEVLYGFGRIVRRLQYMKFGLSKQFDSFMEEADLHELRQSVQLESSDFIMGDFDGAVADQELMSALEHKPTLKEQVSKKAVEPSKSLQGNLSLD